MNSFNHYAYGAIGDWMYRVVAGIELDPAEPGYKHVLIQPQPGGGLTSAEARLETLYGEAASGWALADGKPTVSAAVPPNAHGTVRLPAATLAGVTEGGLAVAAAPGVKRAASRATTSSSRWARDATGSPTTGRPSPPGSTRRRGSAPGRRSRRSSRTPRPEPRSTSAFLASPPTRGSRRPTR